MTDREAMQLALEALENVTEDYVKNRQYKHNKAIAALEKRLAQPEQDWDWRHPKAQALIGAKARLEIKLRLVEQLVEDPNFETTASDMEYWEPLHDKLQGRLAQPEQEPVAWRHKDAGRFTVNTLVSKFPEWEPLYTAPPQRKPWVGLTDEEKAEIWSLHETSMVVTATEAKLKEKNNG